VASPTPPAAKTRCQNDDDDGVDDTVIAAADTVVRDAPHQDIEYQVDALLQLLQHDGRRDVTRAQALEAIGVAMSELRPQRAH